MTQADSARRATGALFEASCVRAMAKQHAQALKDKLDQLEHAIHKLDMICAELPILTLAAAGEVDAPTVVAELVTDPAELLQGAREMLDDATRLNFRMARALVTKLQHEGMTEQQAAEVVGNVFGVHVNGLMGEAER